MLIDLDTSPGVGAWFVWEGGDDQTYVVTKDNPTFYLCVWAATGAAPPKWWERYDQINSLATSEYRVGQTSYLDDNDLSIRHDWDMSQYKFECEPDDEIKISIGGRPTLTSGPPRSEAAAGTWQDMFKGRLRYGGFNGGGDAALTQISRERTDCYSLNEDPNLHPVYGHLWPWYANGGAGCTRVYLNNELILIHPGVGGGGVVRVGPVFTNDLQAGIGCWGPWDREGSTNANANGGMGMIKYVREVPNPPEYYPYDLTSFEPPFLYIYPRLWDEGNPGTYGQGGNGVRSYDPVSPRYHYSTSGGGGGRYGGRSGAFTYNEYRGVDAIWNATASRGAGGSHYFSGDSRVTWYEDVHTQPAALQPFVGTAFTTPHVYNRLEGPAKLSPLYNQYWKLGFGQVWISAPAKNETGWSVGHISAGAILDAAASIVDAVT